MGSTSAEGYSLSNLTDGEFQWNSSEAYLSELHGNWFALSWNENKTFREISIYNIGYSAPEYSNLNLYDFDLKINTNTASTNFNDAVWLTVDEVRGGAPDLYTYTSLSPITSNAVYVYVTAQASPDVAWNEELAYRMRVLEMEVDAVPEPLTMGLLAISGIGILLRRRQK
jgi:hypothetical protein